MKKILLIIILLFLALSGGFWIYSRIYSASQPVGEIGVVVDAENKVDIEVVATNLEIPWEIVFLPTGEMLVSERSGNLVLIDNGNKIKIEGVLHTGEGGLQGVALHPDFSKNNFIYIYFTTKTSVGLINRIERYTLIGNSVSNKKIILDNIPGARFHDGGRIEFGPDGKLYVTTGDVGVSTRAQDLSFLGGKILRLNDDGSVPSDNPFGTAVYSYGHRNPQGLAWDDQGVLWSTEHGRSVILSGFDELNKIIAGQNYGWPDIQGDEVSEGKVTPVIHSGADSTWAPAGAIYLDGDIIFAGLKGEALYKYNIDSQKLTTNFFQDWGRLRAVVLGPDNYIYISTSNTDGRGKVRDGDDKIIKINPDILK